MSTAKSQLGSKLNSTFQLLLNLGKEELGSESVDDYADIIETICALVDAVVEQTENEKSVSAEVSLF